MTTDMCGAPWAVLKLSPSCRSGKFVNFLRLKFGLARPMIACCVKPCTLWDIHALFQDGTAQTCQLRNEGVTYQAKMKFPSENSVSYFKTIFQRIQWTFWTFSPDCVSNSLYAYTEWFRQEVWMKSSRQWWVGWIKPSGGGATRESVSV